MKLGCNNIHADFKLNGISYCFEDLKEVAYNLVKEGEPFENAIGDFLIDWLDNTPFVEVKTSGSTGTPKKIVLKKEQMVNSALATGAYFNLQPKNTALLCLPAEYIAGKMMLVRAMVLGLALDGVVPSSEPLNELSKTYDFAAMVPMQVENSIEQLENIKTLIVGGAAVSNSLKAKLTRKQTTVFETYGMTETITHIAARNIKLNADKGESDNYFKALPNVLFSKDDRDCLIINAPQVSEEFVVTNDIVNLVSKTKFKWLGRFDNVINSGGVKLFPEQIEVKLTSIIRNRFFVAGIPDEILGQKLVLLVEGEMNTAQLLEKIKNSGKLIKLEIPKKVFLLSKFVETSSGKIQRNKNLLLITKTA